MQVALWLSAPLVATFAGLYFYNRSITGEGLVSPYQLYTDLYTPRHVYGFDNVVRGEQRLGPKVLDPYDRWAENLDARLALRNVARRAASSLRLTLGIVPLVLAGTFLLLSGSLRGDWWFPAAAIVSLHAVHVPYWFEGIMGWHYVLESAPYWLLLFGGATSALTAWWRASGRWGMRAWWGGLVAIVLTVNAISIPLGSERDGAWLLWRSQLDRRIVEVRFPRLRYADARARVDDLRGPRPAVVFVVPDPSDRSMDYVTNEPSLSADVLFARVPAGEENEAALRDLAKLFPGRAALVLDASTGDVKRLEASGR